MPCETWLAAFAALGRELSDRNYAVAFDANVSADSRPSAPVNDGPADYHERCSLGLPCSRNIRQKQEEDKWEPVHQPMFLCPSAA
jgi:hypothetical protein